MILFSQFKNYIMLFSFLFSHVKYMEAEMNLVGMLAMLLERTKIFFLLSKTVSSPTFQPDSVQFSYVLRRSISIMINCWCEIVVWKDLRIIWNSKPKKGICFVASPLVYIYRAIAIDIHNTFWWGLYILLELKVTQTLIHIILDFK